jgi:hypothetical protein
MPNEEVIMPEIFELDRILKDSVLLTVSAKTAITDYARTVRSRDTLSELCRILSGQKGFILSYLKSRLRSDSLGSDTNTLFQEMRLEYQQKLRIEEERLRQSELLATKEVFELANFPS